MLIEPIRTRGYVTAIRDTHTPRCALIRYPLASPAEVSCTCGARESVYGARTIFEGPNIITDAGDQYYAELCEIGYGKQQAPTNLFTTLELANDDASNPAPAKGNDRGDMISIIAGTQLAVTAGYPTTSDTDTDNPAPTADTLTWRFDYSAGSFNATNISDGWITVAGASGSEAILNHFDRNNWVTAGVFSKTAMQTLKVIINHLFAGV